jgi:acyl carrier protein
MKDEIVSALRTAVARMIEWPEEEIDNSTHLADLGMDSLQALQLLVMIERDYKLQLSEEDLQLFTSIDAVAELVSSRLAVTATA